MYRFPEHSNGTCFLSQRVSPFYHDLDLGLVGWEPSACRATSEPNSFIQSFLKEIFGGGRGDPKTFSFFDFSSFHPNSFRDTIGWECIVKDDGVRSRLIELQSFLLNKFDVDPIDHVLMFLPRCLHVRCKTRCFQVDCLKIFVFFIHRIHRQKENCLSFAQILAYESRIDDGM